MRASCARALHFSLILCLSSVTKTGENSFFAEVRFKGVDGLLEFFSLVGSEENGGSQHLAHTSGANYELEFFRRPIFKEQQYRVTFFRDEANDIRMRAGARVE